MELDSLINNYKVVKRLGGGGFGEVYLVQENITNELRAIKKLNKSRSDQNDIIHEIQNVGRLRLSNVAAYHHHFWEGEKLHFVMEYCDGGNLDSVIHFLESFNVGFERIGFIKIKK